MAKKIKKINVASDKKGTVKNPYTVEEHEQMLLKAGLSEGDILLLMDADNKRISRLKAQANKKLFGEENAKTLRNNLNLKK